MPDRRTLKSCLLWSARQLLEANAIYTGPVRVVVQFTEEKDELIIRPTKGADGLAAPDLAAGLDGDAALLVGHFLSPEERSILRALRDKQPSKAKVVADRAGVTGSEFYAIWKCLQGRGLVVGEREEYRLAGDWLLPLLADAPSGGSEEQRAAGG